MRGDAIYTVEYTPDIMPARSTNENGFKTSPPKIKIEVTANNVIKLVSIVLDKV